MTDVEEDLDLVVKAKRMLTCDVVLLRLARTDGRDLPEWSAGAHLEMHLVDGISRQYSLCSDPAVRSAWEIAVLREPASRGGSSFIHEQLAVGDTVACRGPRNNFPLEPATGYRFIAGGIGVTPMLPMIRTAEATATPWTLLYGGRSLDSMAFVDELATYGDRVTFHPQDTDGLLDLERELKSPSEGMRVYSCGPEPLLAAIEEICRASWPKNTLHIERFRADLPSPDEARPITVEVARSGIAVTVAPHQSILDALLDLGIYVDSSCSEGTCGSCEVTVLEGEPEHHDVVLTEAERDSGDSMLVCVSRARGDRLKLDI